MTTLSWFVFDQTESAFMVSLIGFFGLAPLMFFGLFGGVIADILATLGMSFGWAFTGSILLRAVVGFYLFKHFC